MNSSVDILGKGVYSIPEAARVDEPQDTEGPRMVPWSQISEQDFPTRLRKRLSHPA